MIQDLAVGAGALLPGGPHDEFLELCAVSTSGQLSEEEQNRLQEHLAVCPACREALREYETVVHDVIPAIGAEQTNRIDPGPGFSQSKVEEAFFDRLATEEGRQPPRAEKKNGIPSAFRRVLPIAPESTWQHVWMLYAAGILLFVTLCLSAYWVGVRHGTDVAKSTPPTPAVQPPPGNESAASLEEQLSDAAHERELAGSRLLSVIRHWGTFAGDCSCSRKRSAACRKPRTSWKQLCGAIKPANRISLNNEPNWGRNWRR